MLSRTKRIFGMGVGCLFVIAAIGISSSASAVTAMYSQGTLNVEAFANDTTTGPSYPYTTQVFLGIPLGTFCNQFKGGGQSPCGGFNTKGQNGLPLAGMDFHALPTTAAPVPFALNEGRIRQKLGTPATSFTYGPNGTKRPANGVPGGSFSYYFPYIYSYSYADLKNAAGNFFAGGGGPGNWSFTKTEGGYNAGSVKVTAGANKFGGTMNLLGYYFTNNGYQRSVGLSVAISSTWKFQAVGGGKASTVATGVNSSGTNYAVNTGVGATYTGFVVATAFQQRAGYDNRNAIGAGNIQLVSPMLTHWTCPSCGSDYETGGVGMLNLTFVPVPEPASVFMLVGGISLLGLVYRANHRS